MVKWVLIPIVIVLALAGLVFVVGVLLPVDHVATARATLDRPPEEVWRALTNVEEAPDWRSTVDRVELVEEVEGSRVWREIGRFGAMTLEVVESDAPRRLVMRIADRDLPFGGTWTYEVEPVGKDSCRLTITEDGEVYNPFFRFMSRYVFGHHGTMETYLEDLGRKLGVEDLSIERVR